ncbi:DUF1127 domain-containing protein [Pontibacterium sp.]|uniref:DUF1127 domain-containing protein n=1 Tax=Pontibacterium sp. TaxID=2036026 RepID=UPI0035626E2D
MKRVIRQKVNTGLGTCFSWYQRYRTRRQLLTLDRDQLKDIGVNRACAQEEAAKPFWRK